MLKYLVLAAALVLAACAPPPQPDTPDRQAQGLVLPEMKTFTRPQVTPPARSNAEMVQDFLDLSFRMESGRQLASLSRFEGPVSLRVTGSPAPSLNADLDALLRRLRTEAGIDITRVAASDDTANITVQSLPQRQLQRLVPQAACFVAPNVASWAEYRRLRRSSELDWATLVAREKVAVFLPSDVSPQEVRDCLHEEIAQALGPLNDLYRLSDSVFNDDNFHTVLTGFDMLMLRVYYAPQISAGMTRAQVAAQVPGLLARFNPAGRRAGGRAPVSTPRSWINQIETALGPGTSNSARLEAASMAVDIARARGLDDTRLAFSLFAYGRLALAVDAGEALGAFLEAAQIYNRTPGTKVHRAHLALHLAAFSLSADRPQDALDLVNRHVAAAAASENAALLATLLMIKAEALEAVGRGAEARAVRLDSLGWARYGFGSDSEVRARLLEIVALSPERPSG